MKMDSFSIETQFWFFQVGIHILQIFFWLWLFLIGATVWSFLWVIVHRRYREKKDWKTTLFERSHCNNCNHKLSLFEIIPIFAYFILWRKCKVCKNRIAPFHLFIEIASGVDLLTAFAIFYWKDILVLFTWWLQNIVANPYKMFWVLGVYIVLCFFQVHLYRYFLQKIDKLIQKKRLRQSH